MTRQRPFADDIATGTPTAGLVPVSAGAGAPPVWGAGGGGGGSSGWTLIEKKALAATTATPVSFVSVPQTFDHLVLFIDVRGSHSGSASIGIQVNGHTASDYGWSDHEYQNSGPHSAGGANVDNSVIVSNQFPGTDKPADAHLTAEIWFPNYAVNDAHRKHIASTSRVDSITGPGDDYPYARQVSGAYPSGVPITSIQVCAFSVSPGFAAGSTMWLYGVGGTGGGGGGGGGDVLLASFQCVGGEQIVRLPASGTITAPFVGLRLECQYRPASAGGSNNQLGVRLNDDAGSNYLYVEAWDRSSGAGSQEGTTTGFTSDAKFYASGMPSAAAPAGANGSCIVTMPFASRVSFWQPLLSRTVFNYFDDTDGTIQEQDVCGFWKSTAAISSVTVRALASDGTTLLAGGLAAGSYFALYGVGGVGGGTPAIAGAQVYFIPSVGGAPVSIAVPDSTPTIAGPLNGVEFASPGWHSNSFGDAYVDIPSLGVYLVTARINWSVEAGGGVTARELWLMRNGGVFGGGAGYWQKDQRTAGGGAVVSNEVSIVSELDAGDHIWMQAYQESGTTKHLYLAELAVVRLGNEP